MPTSTTAAPKPYAARTAVPADKTQKELYTALEKHGAHKLMTFDDKTTGYSLMAFEIPAPTGGVLAFALHLPLPDPAKFSPNAPTTGRANQRAQFANEYEKEKARLWRVCLNLVTAKLIAIQEGATTTEREFFADQVIIKEDGTQTTVYEWFSPQMAELRARGGMPPLLPAVKQPALIASIRED